jgi:hypothetical protein
MARAIFAPDLEDWVRILQKKTGCYAVIAFIRGIAPLLSDGIWKATDSFRPKPID